MPFTSLTDLNAVFHRVAVCVKEDEEDDELASQAS